MSEIREIQLPGRDTWEAGLVGALELAEKFVAHYDANKTVLTLDPSDRKDGVPTVEEVKLSLSLMVAKRMLVEAQADLVHNSMAVSRARKYIMSHPQLPAVEKQRVVEALSMKEALGIRIASGWRVMEMGLKAWQNPNFWTNRNPANEARKLFYAIQGLQERPRETQQQSSDEVQGMRDGTPTDPSSEVSVEGRAGDVLERPHVPGLPASGEGEAQEIQGDHAKDRNAGAETQEGGRV